MCFEIVAKSQYVYSFTTLHMVACLWIVGHCRVMLRANMVKLLVAVVRNENDTLRLWEYKLHLMIFSIKSERTSISNFNNECSTMRDLWQIWNCSLITWQDRHWNAQWLHSVNCFICFFFCCCCIRQQWTWLQIHLCALSLRHDHCLVLINDWWYGSYQNCDITQINITVFTKWLIFGWNA